MWLAPTCTLAVLLAGCGLRSAAYPCSTDADCARGTEQGVCEAATEFCSFIDPACDGGRRYGELSGPVASQCVGGSAPDGGVDTPVPPDCAMWQPEHFDACMIPGPGTAITLTSGTRYIYDTTTGGGTLVDGGGASIAISSAAITQPGGGDVAVWSLDALTLEAGAELRVIGAKPLIIASWGAISVAGQIDAGSHVGGAGPGAGSNPAGCASHAAGAGVDGLSGTGGGGGGGFAGSGAAGGTGDGNGALTAGGVGGTAIAAPAIVIGGCNGGDSGRSTADFAPGGRGGGALVLAGRASITVSGRLLAGGGGGEGDRSTTSSYGGGGGGAGGYLGLDAPTINVQGAIIAANGGAGGGGAVVASTATAGADGQPGAAAAAGGGGTLGEVGGLGSASSLNGGAVSGTIPNGGGGGGGGAAGFIFYWAPTLGSTGATISPAATVGP